MSQRPARKPRVAFVINSLIGGGAERVMCTLLAHSHAQREHFDMSLLLLDIVERAYEPPDWIPVAQSDCAGSLRRSLSAMRRFRRQFRPDVTLSFLERSNFCNVLTAGATPAIISERVSTSAHFEPGFRGAVSKALVRALYPRAARTIAVSQGIADDLADNFGVPREKLVAIANPLDLDAVRAKAAEPPNLAIEGAYVLAAGRLVKNKNFAMLIDAFAAAALDDLKLVILGQGPEREALLAQAQSLGIADRVILPGFEKNPFALMRRAWAFVLPSNAEGFPNSLVEAMAAGAPVISANCATGPSEILADAARQDIAGLTYAAHGVLTPTDDAASLSAALVAFKDEGKRSAYAAKALARAQDYGAPVAAARYWSVITSALGPRSALQ